VLRLDEAEPDLAVAGLGDLELPGRQRDAQEAADEDVVVDEDDWLGRPLRAPPFAGAWTASPPAGTSAPSSPSRERSSSSAASRICWVATVRSSSSSLLASSSAYPTITTSGVFRSWTRSASVVSSITLLPRRRRERDELGCDRRVELPPGLAVDLDERGLLGLGGAVRAVVRQRVVRVGEHEDPGGEGDAGSHQAERIAAAVPALVVRHDDVAGEAAEVRDLAEKPIAEQRMALDLPPLQRVTQLALRLAERVARGSSQR
jgi:hypothetical protein